MKQEERGNLITKSRMRSRRTEMKKRCEEKAQKEKRNKGEKDMV